MEHQMKWHKFLINFSLWVNAVSCLLIGVMGVAVLIDPPGRYRYQPSLKAWAMLIGLGLILVGIYCIVVRFKLARLRSGAAAHLVAVWILSGLLSALFLIVDGFEINLITSLLPTIAMACVNHYYYQKRAELFIH